MNVRDGDFELMTLRSGARAVRHLGHGEVMHPATSPWEEANRLYIDQAGLADLLTVPGPPLLIHDIGLGAGTNAVAALTCARALGEARRRSLEIISFELDLAPLRLALGDPTGFPFLAPFTRAAEALATMGHWEGPGLSWTLRLGDASAAIAIEASRADLVFFDPFSPASNPAMWTQEVFASVRAGCRDGALLMTYSAATPTRVSLLLAGFFVGAGLSTGSKAETTIASPQRERLAAPLGERWVERWRRSTARGPHMGQFTPEIEARILAHPQWAKGVATSPNGSCLRAGLDVSLHRPPEYWREDPADAG